MIYLGKHIHSVALCGECGKPMENVLDGKSAFLLCSCRNRECADCGISMLIERATMQIMSLNPEQWTMNRERAYPGLFDKGGKQLWPQVHVDEKPKMIFSGWRQAHGTHEFVDRNTPADNTCAKCSFVREDSIHKETE